MRSAHTVEQVRAAEAALMARLPEGALMQRAAAGLAHAVGELLGRVYGARVLLLVGSGDNGGDALWAGAFLARRGAVHPAEELAYGVCQTGRRALHQGALGQPGHQVGLGRSHLLHRVRAPHAATLAPGVSPRG